MPECDAAAASTAETIKPRKEKNPKKCFFFEREREENPKILVVHNLSVSGQLSKRC